MDTPTISYVYLTSKSAQCWVPVRWCEGFKEAKITGCLLLISIWHWQDIFSLFWTSFGVLKAKLLSLIWQATSFQPLINGRVYQIGKVHSWRRCGQTHHSNRSIQLSGCIRKRTANTTNSWDRNLTTASFPRSLRYRFQRHTFWENYLAPFGTAIFLEEIWRYSLAAKLFWLIIEILEVDTSQVHFQIYVKLPMTSMKSSFIPRWFTWPTRNSQDTISWHQ